MRRLATAAVVLFLPFAASAQLNVAHTLTAEATRRALQAAEAEARKEKWNVSIAVVDQGGELAGFLRLEGSAPSTIAVSQQKARAAARFRRPTKALDSALAGGRLALLAMEGAMPVEGGVPIIVNGEIVGAVGVSGATSAQDAQVARAAAAVITP